MKNRCSCVRPSNDQAGVSSSDLVKAVKYIQSARCFASVSFTVDENPAFRLSRAACFHYTRRSVKVPTVNVGPPVLELPCASNVLPRSSNPCVFVTGDRADRRVSRVLGTSIAAAKPVENVWGIVVSVISLASSAFRAAVDLRFSRIFLDVVANYAKRIVPG